MRLAAYRTLGDIVAPVGGADRDATAIVFEGRTIDYGALDAAANRLANGLIARGVMPGERVAVLGKNTPTVLELLFGCAKAGVILVPINWRLTAGEVAAILDDAAPVLTFVERGLEALVASDRAVVVFADAGGATYDPDPRGPSADAPSRRGTPADVALLVYTSGTTGRPKGAMVTHGNFARHCDLDTIEPRWVGIERDEVCLATLPLFHVGGLELVLRPLFTGATIVLHREFDLPRIIHDIPHYRVTLTGLVPTALQMLLEHPDSATSDCSSLRKFLYGAAPIPVDLLKAGLARLRCDFAQSYGMTEANGTCVMLAPADHADLDAPRLRSAGRPTFDSEVRIAGEEDEVGTIGEILVRSGSIMKGYWRRPDATAAAIDADGWLHSGDAGYRDADGFIHVCDRLNDMICTGAENVYPAEVESAIYGHADVVEVAVVGVPDARWGEAVAAVVVMRPGAALDAEAVRAFARTRIAGFKVPRHVHFVAALPKSAAGKILRREVRAALAQPGANIASATAACSAP